jgi:hypothetical protein
LQRSIEVVLDGVRGEEELFGDRAGVDPAEQEDDEPALAGGEVVGQKAEVEDLVRGRPSGS